MENEKLKILKMLENKEITIDEASKLLDSHNNIEQNKNANNNSKISEEFSTEIKKKFDAFTKEFEPKFQKATKVIIEKTMTVADKLSKSIQSYQDTLAKNPKDFSSSSKSSEKITEFVITSNDNQLNLSSLNGDISIRGYNGDKLTAKIFYTSKKGSSDIELIQLANKYLVNYNEDDFESVSIDILLPEKSFSNILIDATNGNINVNTLVCQYLVINSIRGKTYLDNIVVENLKLDCNNNDIYFKNVCSQMSKLENYNGNIFLDNIDIEKLKVSSFNCAIQANIQNYVKFDEYIWEIEASNDKIILNVPSSKNIGYYVNARTSLNVLKIGIIGLNYLSNSETFIEARSLEYDTTPKHVLLRLETSNALLSVN